MSLTYIYFHNPENQKLKIVNRAIKHRPKKKTALSSETQLRSQVAIFGMRTLIAKPNGSSKLKSPVTIRSCSPTQDDLRGQSVAVSYFNPFSYFSNYIVSILRPSLSVSDYRVGKIWESCGEARSCQRCFGFSI